jgi:hypothetical protein
MTPIDLPAPVLPLVAAGRAALRSRPLQQTTPVASAGTPTEYALRHGMLAWANGAIDREAVVAHMTRSLHGVQQLLQIVDYMERNGVLVVTLKGPAFAEWLYGDACARRFADLDLLVSIDQRETSRQLLEAIGFERRLPTGAGDVVYASIGACSMGRASDLPVDLHWTLAARRFPRVLDAADVLRNSIVIQIGGRPVRVPCPEHAAVIALTHSAKHLWYALELPFSIAALACRDDIDWQTVRDVTARAGTLRGAAAGLALAADLFAVDVPAPFRGDITLSDVRELRRCAFETLALPPRVFPDRTLERRIHTRSFDGVAHRLLYDIRRLAEPTRAEWEWIALPSPLASLYWPTRLVRLALLAMNGRPPRGTPVSNRRLSGLDS